METNTFSGFGPTMSMARTILKQLKQSNLAENHRLQIGEALDLVDDIGNRVLTIQTAQIELQQQNAELRAQITDLNDWKVRRAQYRLFETSQGGFVYQSIEGERKHFACYTCAESKREIHPLQRDHEYSGTHTCASCKTSYATFQAKTLDPNAAIGRHDPYTP